MALLVVAFQCQKQLNSVKHFIPRAAENETRVGATELIAAIVVGLIGNFERLIVMWSGGGSHRVQTLSIKN